MLTSSSQTNEQLGDTLFTFGERIWTINYFDNYLFRGWLPESSRIKKWCEAYFIFNYA